MNIHAVLYTKPNCIQCKMTEKRLESLGAEYVNHYYNTDKTNVLDVNSSDEAKKKWSIKKIEKIKAKYGIQQLPLVKVVNDDGDLVEYWSGFRPNLIDKYFKEK